LKKVIHIITTIERGGAENQLLILVKEQIKLKYAVEIVYLKGKPELADEFVEIGAYVNNSISGLNIIQQIIRTKLYLRKKESILHAHLPRAELLAAICRNGNFLIFSRHNAEQFFPGAPRLISSILSKFVVKRSKCGIAISEAVLNFLLENNELIKNFNMEIVTYGFNFKDNNVKISSKAINLETTFGSESFIIGTVSRLTEQKDLQTLLRAFRIVRNSITNAKLIIIGIGPLEDELKEIASDLKIIDDIYWVGKTANVFDYMQIFNVFVLTSRYEGFGLVLLEAMSMNLPIVSSNNSAFPEVLGKDFIGLCETGNENIFAERMVNVLNDKFKMELLSQTAIRRQLFTPEIMSKRVNEIYNNLK